MLGLTSSGLLATVIPVTDADPTQDGLTADAEQVVLAATTDARRAELEHRVALVRTVVSVERELGPVRSDAAKQALAELWQQLRHEPASSRR